MHSVELPNVARIHRGLLPVAGRQRVRIQPATILKGSVSVGTNLDEMYGNSPQLSLPQPTRL
jgi:hypothetical protein